MSSPPLVDTTLVRDGVAGIALEGDLLRATLVPQAGAKLLELVHRPSGRDLLWRNPRVPLRPTYTGAAFDDVWCGGWDELFPTDGACELGSNRVQDHGDLWCGPWEWEVEHDDGERATVVLRRDAICVPCRMEKRVTIRRDRPTLEFAHRLTNLGTQPVPYVWNLHVAHAIARASRVHLPATRLGVEPPDHGRFDPSCREVRWPRHDGEDLAEVLPAERGLTEFLHALDLRAGWCAVVHADGLGLRLDFDPSVFRTVWTWGVYGGWRGHHVLLTEPSTSPPGSLAVNLERGTAAVLAAGAVLETAVTASVLAGVAHAPGDVEPLTPP